MAQILNETLSSGTTPVYSDAIKLSPRQGFCMGIEWTSTLEATAVIQLGISKFSPDDDEVFWFDTDETFPDVPAGTAGTSGQSWGLMMADRVRLKVTRSAGSGTIIAWATWK